MREGGLLKMQSLYRGLLKGESEGPSIRTM